MEVSKNDCGNSNSNSEELGVQGEDYVSSPSSIGVGGKIARCRDNSSEATGTTSISGEDVKTHIPQSWVTAEDIRNSFEKNEFDQQR